MSIKNPNQFARVPLSLLGMDGVKGSTIATYVSLASYADRSGFCFPSVPTIAKRAGISEKIARRECQLLISLGFLESRKHFDKEERQSSNRYYLTWQRDNGGKNATGEELLSSEIREKRHPDGVESDTQTKSITKQIHETTALSAEIVSKAWTANGSTQRVEAVIKVVSDALSNGIEASRLESALKELKLNNAYVSAFSLNEALNPKKRSFSLLADQKVDWSLVSEDL